MGTCDIQGDKLKGTREKERAFADSEQDSVTSAGMLAEPIRL